MKTNQLVWLLMCLMFGVAAAKQTNSSPGITNSVTVEELKARAEKGDVTSQSSLGFRYFFGVDIDKNFTEGIRWLTIEPRIIG